jgi:hypothetical protein
MEAGAWDGVVVGRIRTLDVHRAVLTALVDGLRAGIPGEVLSGVDAVAVGGGIAFVQRTQIQREHCSARIAELDRAIALALRRSLVAENDEDEFELVAVLSDLRKERRAMRAELDELDREGEPKPLDGFTGEVASLLPALAHLAGESPKLPLEIVEELGRAIELTMEPIDDKVRLEIHLTVATDDGRVARLGPVFVALDNRVDAVPPPVHSDRYAHLERLLSTVLGYKQDEAGSRARLRTDVRSAAGRLGLPAESAKLLGACWFPEIPAAVLAAYGGLDLGGLPPDMQRGPWLDLMVDTFRRPVERFKIARHIHPDRDRQFVLDAVRRAGGTMLRSDLMTLAVRNGIGPRIVREASASTNPVPSILLRGGHWPTNGGGSRSDPATVSLMPCECGAPEWFAIRVPEIPTGLLCSSCLRTGDGVVFPSLYREFGLAQRLDSWCFDV